MSGAAQSNGASDKENLTDNKKADTKLIDKAEPDDDGDEQDMPDLVDLSGPHPMRFVRKFGTLGKSEGQLDHPSHLATSPKSGGLVFVCDEMNHRIQVFHYNGKFVRAFGSQGSEEGQMINPYYIAVTADGKHVYVQDHGNQKISVFTDKGKFVKRFGPPELSQPWAIAIDRMSNVYVYAWGEEPLLLIFNQESQMVGGFSLKDESSAKGTDSIRCGGIAISPEGMIYISDWANHCIKVYRPDGKLVLRFGEKGDSIGQFNNPRGLCVSASGNLYVADKYNHRIQVFNARSGEYMTKLGYKGTENGAFTWVNDVALSHDQTRLFATDSNNNRVQIFDLLRS